MQQELHVSVQRNARYTMLGKCGPSTEEAWLVLHGYGMLASYFAQRFQKLVTATCCVVAPEALQRFYLEGTGGRVGASWMTKDDRETDIQDNLKYLSTLTAHVEQEAGRSLSWNVLGFSQGFPTAARWAIQSKVPINSLTAWGSDIPQDVQSGIRGKWSGSSLNLVIATDDPYISEERLSREMQQLTEAGISYTLHRYTGGHRIVEDTLLELNAALP